MNKMKSLIFLAMVFLSTLAQAEIVGYKWFGSSFTTIEIITSGGGGDGPEPYWISHGTWTTTLDAFIQNGEFCKWRGKHIWGPQKFESGIFITPMQNGCGQWTYSLNDFPDKCIYCGQCRKKISKQIYEWEP